MRIILSLILVLIAGSANANNFSNEKDLLEEQLFVQLKTETIQVPALKHKMRADEVISKADIIYVELDSRRVDRGYIADASELIGKSPVRPIFANRAILAEQIKEQTLVHEKKAVTIYFKNKFIEMQDMGVALEDGTKGDFIRVKNATSGIVINAKVVGENLVEVAPQGAILARN